MNKKKAGLIAGGALAVLVAASPLAWAADNSGDSCTFTGDNAKQTSEISTDNPLNTVAQAPTGGDNAGHYAECSDYGHDNGQGNGQGNLINGQEVPGFPDAPELSSLPAAPAFPAAPQIPQFPPAGN